MGETFTSSEIPTRFGPASWQGVLFAEFEAALASRSRQFPCVFGVTGFKAGHLRFAFPDPLEPASLAPILADYLASAREIGRMTSLVAFARPGPVRPMADYRARFWSLLDGLARIDGECWPGTIPQSLRNPAWEFCFAGEPVFVVCNTPAHVFRQSRRSSAFMVTFQPRWVFEGIMDSDDPAVLRALAEVRSRLANFDAITAFPWLGRYGDPDNREFRQYFIDDENAEPACPFHRLGVGSPKEKGKVA